MITSTEVDVLYNLEIMSLSSPAHTALVGDQQRSAVHREEIRTNIYSALEKLLSSTDLLTSNEVNQALRTYP